MNYLKALIVYGQFFTAFPLPFSIRDFDRYFRQGILVFPLFSGLYGGFLGLVYSLACLIFSRPVAFFFSFVADLIASRGLHYDALADMADGMFSSRAKEDRLKIMRDPNLGVMGVLALIVYCVGSFILAGETLGQLSWSQGAVLLAWVKLLSRGGLASLFFRFKYSGHSPGLGTLVEGMGPFKLCLVQGICIMLAGWLHLHLACFYGLLLLALQLYRAWIVRTLHGLSGDTLGASVLISELFLWLCLAF